MHIIPRKWTRRAETTLARVERTAFDVSDAAKSVQQMAATAQDAAARTQQAIDNNAAGLYNEARRTMRSVEAAAWVLVGGILVILAVDALTKPRS